MNPKIVINNKGKPLIKVPESKIIKLLIQEAYAKGHFLERVNAGGMYNAKGQFIKFGWGKKPPDLVGGRKLIITQDMVGKTICQLMVREAKHSLWVYTGTPHEKAQKETLDRINEMGGDACFANDVGTI